ncbi:ketosteroid isomerase [Carbonactinospora thermoautotrophica]|uniref:Ketosteroid isomerase n=3 Tax=Carbonactinospora thermoautotrophica TaxID=1469144 RepID=A0A132N4U1_9ACTN|nr:ketosteroid isomerase [Carbonactinospora thermoautotrophica]KWX05814.1 ketosteroid isomerase [Carbonactinospora thermoautotrophica]
MPMHPNEKVLRVALDAIARGDRDAFARVVAEDVIVHFPGRSPLSGELRGRGVLAARIAELTGGSLKIEPHDVLASDDHAVGIYLMRVDCPGKSIEWRQVNVYHIRAGKIVEVWQNPFEQDAVDEFFSQASRPSRD